MTPAQAGLRSVCSFVLLMLCLSGCGRDTTDGSGGARQALTVVSVTDEKVDVEVLTDGAKMVSLYIGDKKWGSSGPAGVGKKALASLEVSDQIRMEDGSVGYGMVVTTGGGGGSSKQFLAMGEDGPAPHGKVKIRAAAAVVQSADVVTVADIETPDGSLVPVSFRIE